ncbi:Bromodomain-containing protein [Artemisia annua]|uniref:Bromodomain-containing protein n=1 Tax=Artemisia annua TaxID=35608 RepID=A0A2U1KC95_ARTAN|nr:Bromodomain-containing protein [Artemisia annua]
MLTAPDDKVPNDKDTKKRPLFKAKEIKEFYLKKCPKIFPQNWNVTLKDTSNGKGTVIYSVKDVISALKTPIVKDVKHQNLGCILIHHPDIEKDHLVKLMKQLIIHMVPSQGISGRSTHPTAAYVPTLFGTGVFSLL